TTGGTLAQTGSDATTLGLLAGLAAIGAGTGILVASRRRTN
ncbi:MAG: LPXTG cell wall anchor domain-containing protein, partial [Actinomycetia bacterium]|nr:LPXTG cell wall anchor domain-containing protein [Actinomycetes bacterium]MCH9800259.1 LPXTG cell wall anchor domain-containing protein [Actinomycetes bacterium]